MVGDGLLIQRVGCNGPARRRLLCFPYAGGHAAAYRNWPRYLTDTEVLAVQLPGRMERAGEQAYRNMETALRALVPQLQSLAGPPMIYFGHSMGAVMAFELALRMAPARRPAALVLSGRSAPNARNRPQRMHDLPRAELLSALQAFGGMPAQIIAETELLRTVEPVLRADFELIETWRESGDAIIEIPVLCWAGSADPAASVPDVGHWRRNAGGEFSLRVFDGDHFFIHRSEPTVLHILSDELTALGL